MVKFTITSEYDTESETITYTNIGDKKEYSKEFGNEGTPKRGEIVEVKNFGTNEYEYGVFIAEIEKEYDGRKYLVDVEGHPITIRKEMRQKQPKEETIYVPDNITIEKNTYGGSEDFCIKQGKQALGYYDGIYTVFPSCESDKVKCKLIPCDVKDLEVGGTYYHTDLEEVGKDIDKLQCYCKYLGDGYNVFWSDKSTVVRCGFRNNRYKVVPIE